MTRKKTAEALPRSFTAKSKPFFLSQDERAGVSQALSPDPVSDDVIDQVQDAIRQARADTRLGIDAPRAATKQGGKAIARIVRCARDLDAALAVVNDSRRKQLSSEVQHYLDLSRDPELYAIDLPGYVDKEKGEYHELVRGKQIPAGFRGPYEDVREVVAAIWVQIRRAHALHEQELARRPGKRDGPPAKGAAFGLALRLAPIWRQHSGRGWSHNGPWGRFVALAFQLGEIRASAPLMARNAAKHVREGKPLPRTVAIGS